MSRIVFVGVGIAVLFTAALTPAWGEEPVTVPPVDPTPIKDTLPPLDQIDGLCSVRKIKEVTNSKVLVTGVSYDYLLMDGTKFSSPKQIYPKQVRDLRPWSERSLKNKIVARTWEYVIVPSAQSATPVMIGLFRR